MHRLSQIAPTTAAVAKEASEALSLLRPVLAREKKAKTISLETDGAKVRVPLEAFQLLLRVLAEMEKGNAITIVPVHAELTTQQAAELLNVSRPFLVALLEEGRIPFRMIGTRRRVKFADLLEFKRKEELEAKEVLAELAAEAQKLKLGY